MTAHATPSSIVDRPAAAEPATTITAAERGAGYQLVAELFLYPEARDAERALYLRAALRDVPEAELVDAFLATERAHDVAEYLDVLELAPPCPLYLGAYLFEEPASCRGAGMSDRNGYMLDLKATYRHFGLEPDASEMADFLPLVAEFLAMTAETAGNDSAGVRHRMLERMVAPALPVMRERLERYESPYARLIAWLAYLVDDDLRAAPTDGVPTAGEKEAEA